MIKKNNIVLFIIGIFIIIIYFKYGNGIPCLFYEVTGWYCPGCGSTRAIIALLQLNLYQAFRYNMWVIILLPFFIIYLIYKKIFKGNKKIPNVVWNFILILTILFGIARNIQMLSFLAPITII